MLKYKNGIIIGGMFGLGIGLMNNANFVVVLGSTILSMGFGAMLAFPIVEE